MPRQRGWRDVDGIVLLDKPGGISSNHALQQVRRIFQARKAGHTGSLDPLATGMLPVCLGQGTKISGFLLDARKRYRVVARLGRATNTGDAEGTMTRQTPVPELSAHGVEPVLASFRGELDQVPPMYSALKHQGRRLYALARAGESIERRARRVRVDELRLVAVHGEALELEVLCSKGTYIRTLIEDLGNALGTAAHVSALRRLAVEPFSDEPMAPLDALQALSEEQRAGRWLLPVDRALTHLPALEVDAQQARWLFHGRAVAGPPAQAPGPLRLYDSAGAFLGVGERTPEGGVRPRRMFPGLNASAAATPLETD